MPRSYLVSVLSSSSVYCTCLSRGSFSAASARRVKTAGTGGDVPWWLGAAWSEKPRPSIRAQWLPQKKIFDDGVPVAGRKGSSAISRGHPTISDRFRPSLDFDDLVKRVAMRAVEMQRRGLSRHTQPPPLIAQRTISELSGYYTRRLKRKEPRQDVKIRRGSSRSVAVSWAPGGDPQHRQLGYCA